LNTNKETDCKKILRGSIKAQIRIFFSNNQPDALIVQIYSFTKLYVFGASSLPIIRSFLPYFRHTTG